MHVNVFDYSKILAGAKAPYIEFLRVPSLSVGMYVLEVGATDHQTPHSEDEVYYVASGRAKMRTETDGVAKNFDVDPGTIIFIPAQVQHAFYDIIQRLAVMVFFAPAEHSRAPAYEAGE
jgi:mannose-6-phosphate isomerase-like protein (cupin superfamily)